jgi:hypothetical protein
MRHDFQTSGESGERVSRKVERLAILADSRATNLVDQKMMYISISPAKVSAAVYTDDRAKLVSGIMERAGARQVALGSDSTATRQRQKTGAVGLG